MKKIIVPNNLNQIEISKDYVEGFIIGINDMNVNVGYNIDLSELPSLISLLKDKEIFISLTKNIENRDIESLKHILLELNNYSITGVLYSDVSFVKLSKELSLNYDLVWSQEHLTTNYETINYWNNFGIKYTFLSSDITLNDILEIRKNTKSKLMVNIFGYLPMFVSKRHIVQNYLKQFNISDQSSIYYMKKDNELYPIIDNDVATQVYSSKILNSIKEYYHLKQNGIDYITLNGFNIDDDHFKTLIDIINNLNESNINKISQQVDELFPNTFDGFMYTNTISKVKKND